MRLASLLAAAAVLASFDATATTTQILNRRLQPTQTVGSALHQAGLPDEQVEAIIGALTGVFDFRKARAGDQLRIVLRDRVVDYFDYRQSALDEWSVRRD